MNSTKVESREQEYVELWEIHDRRTGKVLVLATGHKRFLRNEEDRLQGDGLPFVDFSFVPRSRSLWVTSDANYLYQAQCELTDIALQSTKTRRASTLKFLYGEDAIDEDELVKATSAEVGVGVKVRGGIPLQDAIQFFQARGDMQLYQEAENTRRNAREIVGFSRNQFGEFESTGRRTATEASVVDRASQLRMSRRQGVVAKAYVECFKKINALVAENWKTPRVVEILGEQGVATWEAVTGGMLQGEYTYKVSFSSEPVETQQSRRQAALQTFLTLAQDPTVDAIQLRRFLARAFNDPEFSKIFKPGILEGDPEAIMRAQMLQQMGQGTNGSQSQSGGTQGVGVGGGQSGTLEEGILGQ